MFQIEQNAQEKVLPREVLFQIQRVGTLVKITAVDPDSLIEVSVQGPASAGEAALRRVALDKLNYRLSKEKERQK